LTHLSRGKGVKVQWNSKTIIVGSSELMKNEGIQISESAKGLLESKQSEGMTSLLVALDRRLLGIISIADTLREGAKDAIDKIGSKGYRKSGCSRGTASWSLTASEESWA
jgi:cation transport ATPase